MLGEQAEGVHVALADGVDVLAEAAALFCQLTGRLGLTSVEFDQMKADGWERIPFSLIERALTVAIEKTPEARRHKARISWYRVDVQEVYADWRRAIGPQ